MALEKPHLLETHAHEKGITIRDIDFSQTYENQKFTK